MSLIISDIRSLMSKMGVNQININAIYTKLTQTNPARYNNKQFKKENLQETLNFYKKLSVVYLDDEENVIFL